MKSKRRIRHPGRLLAAVVFVLVVVYILVQMFGIMYKDYQTEIAMRYTMTDSITMQAAAAFESQPVEGSGQLGYLVESGERVSTGQAVAEKYGSAEQALANRKLQSLEHQAALLEQSGNIDGASLDVLTQQMQNSLYEVLDALDSGEYASCAEDFDQYLVAANKVQLMTGQTEGFSASLEQIQSQSAALQEAAGTPDTITAPASGYFVPATGQSVQPYTTEELSGMTAAQLQQTLEQPVYAQEQGAGRIITDYHWSLFGVLPQEEAARLSSGQKLTVRLPKRGAELPMTVALLEKDEESGLVKVQLTCENITAQIVGLGIEEAELLLAEYEGLRVSREAQHVAVETDENGVQHEVYGVYVKQGGLMYFRKITDKIYENDEYILLPLDGSTDGDNQVREYDEVIVKGKNLGDQRLL